jgi:predicted ester cyclase
MFSLRATGLVLLIIVPTWIEAAHASNIENNKALVRRFVAAANELDDSALDSILAPDMVRHSQSTPELNITNLAEFKAYLKQDAATIDGAHVDFSVLIAEGNRVALFGVYTGTQVGPIGPIEATGKPVSIDISAMFRIQDNLIVEFWVLWDNAALLTQLGHSPFAPLVVE